MAIKSVYQYFYFDNSVKNELEEEETRGSNYNLGSFCSNLGVKR
jgi:hypothetical protein